MTQIKQLERSLAALYGKGIFTTSAVYDGDVFLWDKHWRRLTRDAERVGIDLRQFSEDSVKAAAVDKITRGNITDGRVRVTFADNRPGEIWPGDTGGETTSMSILVGERRPVPRPFRVTVSRYAVNSRSPLAGVKSCNYLENILAIADAQRRGFHEAAVLNERGHLAGACMANLFWVKNGGLVTPSLSTGCLPGTTREFVMERLACEEVEAELGELETAGALFLTSAGLGVVAVDELDGRSLSAVKHPILRLIKATT